MLKTMAKCKVCGKITALCQPFGDATAFLPRAHKTNGIPCLGKNIDAILVDVEVKDSPRQPSKRRKIATSKSVIASLRADLAAARAALEAVEWVEGTDDFAGKFKWCPWCKNDELVGHADDCPRQVALGLAKKPEETR